MLQSYVGRAENYPSFELRRILHSKSDKMKLNQMYHHAFTILEFTSTFHDWIYYIQNSLSKLEQASCF